MTVLTCDRFARSAAVGEVFCRLCGRRYLGCEIDAEMAVSDRAHISAALLFDHGGPA